MSKILVADAKGRAAKYFSQILPAERFAPILTAFNAGEARRLAASNAYDLVIINSPLPDDFGLELALDLSRFDSSGILLLTERNYYEQVLGQTETAGILVLAKPFERLMVLQTINLLAAMKNKLRKLEERAESLQVKMEEIKLVNRAKLLLMEQSQMTEAQAHRYIEKAAMDLCLKRREIAENIIKSSSN